MPNMIHVHHHANGYMLVAETVFGRAPVKKISLGACSYGRLT